MNVRQKRLVTIATGVAVVASVGLFLLPTATTLVEQVFPRLSQMRWIPLLIALGLALVFWPAQACVWNLVLWALRHRLPAGTAVRIWLTTQTCRWLPGGVWHFGSRTLHAVGHGIPSPVAVASLALELLLTVAAWGSMGVAGMIWYGQRDQRLEQMLSDRTAEVILGGALGVLLLGGLAWLSSRWFPRKFRSLRERMAALRALRPHPMRAVICLWVYAALAVFNGLAFYAVVHAAAPAHDVPFWAAVTANALAWTVGLFAVMAPSGLVVREATLALQLSLWLPPAEAVMVAVVWRLLQLVVEMICVALAVAPQVMAPRRWRGARRALSRPALHLSELNR